MKILLIEDDALLLNGLQKALEQQQYCCDIARSLSEARRYTLDDYDLIILDLGLPDGDGLTLLKQWRQQGCSQPVLILTARDSLDDRVKGLDLGADDYLIKPFGMGELLARVRAALRRRGSQVESLSPWVQLGEVRIDLALRRVTRGDEELHLTPIEFRLLGELLAHPGKVLTHRHLLNAVWGPTFVEHNHYLRIYMGHLRQKLERDPTLPSYLITETGIGYRFIPDQMD